MGMTGGGVRGCVGKGRKEFDLEEYACDAEDDGD